MPEKLPAKKVQWRGMGWTAHPLYCPPIVPSWEFSLLASPFGRPCRKQTFPFSHNMPLPKLKGSDSGQLVSDLCMHKNNEFSSDLPVFISIRTLRNCTDYPLSTQNVLSGRWPIENVFCCLKFAKWINIILTWQLLSTYNLINNPNHPCQECLLNER